MLETQGQSQDPQEPQKKRPGAWVPALALAASFVVPGDSETAPGSPAYEYGSQAANFEKVPVVVLRVGGLKETT